jgi:hypothetical protein
LKQMTNEHRYFSIEPRREKTNLKK